MEVPENPDWPPGSRRGDRATLVSAIVGAFEAFAARPFLGEREPGGGAADGFGPYRFIDYHTAFDRCRRIGAGLRATLAAGGLVGICLANCPTWYLVDLACALHGLVSVPIAHTIDPPALADIAEKCELTTLVCDGALAGSLRRLCAAGRCPLLRTIVVADPVASNPTDDRVTLAELEAIGRIQPTTIVERGDDDLLTILFTSGSTGTPRGAMISAGAWHRRHASGARPTPSRVWYSFQPASHVLDRGESWRTFLGGGRIGFPSRRLDNLDGDLAALRPTRMSAPAHFWSGLRREYNQLLAARPGPADDVEAADVARQMRARLGGRLRLIRNAGAPAHPGLLQWLTAVFRCRVLDAYGSTEAGGVMNTGRLSRSVQWRLADVPELGYFTRDSPPRGEVLLRSDRMFFGYYRDPELTRVAFTADGWFRTGDIGLQESDGMLRVVDRKHNVFKLPQGEFVAPELLEGIYGESLHIAQLYVHADPLQPFVLAVVVPSALALAEARGAPDLLAESLHRECLRLAARQRLRPWEIPRGIVVAEEPFSLQNGRLTGPSKLCRPAIRRDYGDRLAALFGRLERVDQRHDDRTPGDETSVVDLLAGCIPGVGPLLVAQSFADGPEFSLRELGADSLSTARLVAAISQRHGVELTVSQLLDDRMTVSSLAARITGSRKRERDAAETADLVADLRRDAQLDASLRIVHTAADHGPGAAILVTGGNGFIGRFLVHELLQRTTAPIFVLIRGDDEAAARTRMLAALATTPLACSAACPRGPHRHSVADLPAWLADRVAVVRGALEHPGMGLPAGAYEQLARRVGAIYHCAAFVNHVLPYSAHRPANVDGTIELLRFACHGSAKWLHHVSSVAAITRDMITGDRILESTPLGTRDLERLDGYGQSKWVGEALVSAAARRGVLTTIFRPAFVSGHSASGHANPDDMMCRLLRTIAELGQAPVVRDDRILDMTPVDYVAGGLAHVALAVQRAPRADGACVHHVVSPGCAVTIPALVEALRAAEVPVESIASEAWCELVRSTPATPFAPLLARFREGGASLGRRLDATHFHTATADCEDLPARDLSPAALRATVEFLRSRGFIVGG